MFAQRHNSGYLGSLQDRVVEVKDNFVNIQVVSVFHLYTSQMG